MTTQVQCVLTLLRERPDGITAMDALQECGCMRLAARIADLRFERHDIVSEMERLPNGKRVARYRLIQPTLWP